MRITVAVCTWNRAPSLRRLLECMTRIAIPSETTLEILVVNNACTDATDDTVRHMSSRLPVRLLHEPRTGLSHARNRAVRVASGDYIIWIDDDVVLGPDWLTAYASAFSRHPDAHFFGGPIRPRFLAPPPAWLERGWSAVAVHYAVRECADIPAQVRRDYQPFGANLAIRTDVQRQHAYDAALGRAGNVLNGGEESAVVGRVLAAGGTGWWVPAAGVDHCIDADRMTIRHLRRMLMREGAQQRSSLTEPPRRWRLWADALSAEASYRIHRIVSPPEVWVPSLQKASLAAGMLRPDS